MSLVNSKYLNAFITPFDVIELDATKIITFKVPPNEPFPRQSKVYFGDIVLIPILFVAYKFGAVTYPVTVTVPVLKGPLYRPLPFTSNVY